MTQPILNSISKGNQIQLDRLKKNKTMQNVFSGYNARDVIADDESPFMVNMCSDAYPAIRSRSSREIINTILGTARIIFSSSSICGVIGTDFYWGGFSASYIRISGLANNDKCLVDFNGNILIFPDKRYYDYINNTSGSFNVRDGNNNEVEVVLACVHENRVFAVKGSNLYASKLGDFTVWNQFTVDPAPSATDSYAADVASTGDFVGIIPYGGHIELMKNEITHELYGSIPANFKILDAFKEGIINNNTFAEINGVLYFLTESGIKIYSGGFPRNISSNLNISYINGAAGSNGEKYYVSVYNGSTYDLFVYDTRFNIWVREDNLNVKSFALYNDYLYALVQDGSAAKVFKLASGSEIISWEYITKNYDENIFNEKDTVEIKIQFKLAVGQTMNVYASYDFSDFVLIKSVTSTTSTIQNVRVQLPKQNVDFIQYKITGSGDFILYRIERVMEIKSEFGSVLEGGQG